MLARWSYTRIDELIASGLHEAIDILQQDLNRLHDLIEARYFIASSSPAVAPRLVSTSQTSCP